MSTEIAFRLQRCVLERPSKAVLSDLKDGHAPGWIETLRPSALATFITVDRVGLPSPDRALLRPTRLMPTSRARAVIFRARATTPKARAIGV